MKPLPLPGIILAAGRSRRMGTANKLLLKFHGKPLLQHVLDAALASSLAPILLVLGPNHKTLLAQIKPGRAQPVINNEADTGYGSSLQAGLKALTSPCPGAMFLLGDQPLVQTATIEQLIQAFLLEPDRWVAPSYRGKRGNPVITPAAWFATIHNLQGDTGPRKHLHDPAAKLKLIEVADNGVLLDVDTMDDFSRLKKL